MLFFFHDPATTEIYTLSLHDALPIWPWANARVYLVPLQPRSRANAALTSAALAPAADPDRKSTRLNSSHVEISYAVFCLKKKTLTDSPCFSVFILCPTSLSPSSELCF